ncbi:MAG TPA: tetratricopeptide repeat protein [Burkholderiales bacterium]|nr:tetratricopeptide repeat protein [Burkholderiales bacterium]
MLARYIRGAVLFALYALCQSGIAAGPDLQKAEDLLRANKAQEAYDLLEPFEFDQAGELKYDYLLGLAALESGKPEKSSLVFERVLAVEPRYLGVRLDLARSYFQLGDIARATQEFQTVLAQNPPPDLKANAERYMQAIEQAKMPKRFSLTSYIEIGGGRDSNVNSSTSDNPVNLSNGQPFFLDSSSLKRGDNYGTAALGGEMGYVLTPNWSVYGGLDTRYRWYHEIDTADYGTLDGHAGIGLTLGQHFFRVGVTGERFFLDQQAYRKSYGGIAEYRYQAGDRDQLSLNTQYTEYRHLSELLTVNDFDQALGSIGWLHVLASGRTLFSINLNGGHEDAVGGRPDGDALLLGGRLFGQTALTDKVGIFATAGAQRSKYKDENVSFGETRADWLYDVTIGMNWQFASKWSLRPQVTYTKNNSNIPLYDFDRLDMALNLRRDFQW